MSNQKNTGGPAFPTTYRAYDGAGGFTTEYVNGMELRQYAAIELKVPDSGEEWLDDMIRQSLRNEFAAKAMQGLLSACEGWTPPAHGDELSKRAYTFADAMLKAREQ